MIKDEQTLRAALIGLKTMEAEVTQALAQFQVAGRQDERPRRHRLSAAARKRISVASKKRWAEFRKAKAK